VSDVVAAGDILAMRRGRIAGLTPFYREGVRSMLWASSIKFLVISRFDNCTIDIECTRDPYFYRRIGRRFKRSGVPRPLLCDLDIDLNRLLCSGCGIRGGAGYLVDVNG
jgi:hypothetical protein